MKFSQTLFARCLSLLLAALVFVSMMPTLAIAEATEEAPQVQQEQPVKEEKSEAPKAEPEAPKAEPEAPKAEPEAPKAEPEAPKAEPEQPKEEEKPAPASSEPSEEASEPAKDETPAAAEPAKDESAAPAKEEAAPAADNAPAEEVAKPEEKEEEKKEEEKEEYPAQTLTANAGGVKVTLKAPEGALPEGSKLKAHQVGQQYIDAVAETLEAQGRELTDAVAIDVMPVNKDGKEIQPKKTVKVTFSGAGLDLESGDEVDVFRVSDDASKVTDMNGSGSANTQSFNTDHFTIYVSTGSTTDPNGDGTNQANSTSHRLEMDYGQTVTLNTSHSRDSASYWSVYAGGTHLEFDPSTRKVTNNNVSGAVQNATIRWTRSGTTENYYIQLNPQDEHTVTFKLMDAGSSTWATVDTKTVQDGGSVTAPDETSPKQGADGKWYVFSGWCSDEACTEVAELNDIKSDMDVYGKYTLVQHTVNFYLMDAGQSTFALADTKTVDDGGSVTAPSEPAEKIVSGGITYEFSGWCTDSSCGTIADLSDIRDDEDIYGKYTKKVYNVTFMFDGSQESVVEVASGDPVPSDDIPAHSDTADKTFTGWCTDDTYATKADLSKITGDMTVYGKMVNKVKLQYYPGTTHQTTLPTPNPVYVPAGTEVHLGTATRAGHALLGWAKTAGATTADYDPGEDIVIDADTDLYAVWTEGRITITYYRNYDDSDVTIFESEDADDDSTHELTEHMPTRSNYLFLGWATKRDGSEPAKLYGPKDTITVGEEAINLYAIWGPYDSSVSLETDPLPGFKNTVTYDGLEHSLERWTASAENGPGSGAGGNWSCPIDNTNDNPNTSLPHNHKYMGYIRVGNTNVGDNHHHIYAKVFSSTPGDMVVSGTNAGTYGGPIYAEIFTHNSSTNAWDPVNEFMRITNNLLIIEPATITITTESKEKEWNGEALTAGGTIKVGSAAAKTIPAEGGLVELVNGEKVWVKMTGTQTNLGKSDNTYEIDWNHSDSTAVEANYKISENLGKLSVYVKADYDSGDAGDNATNMPTDENVYASSYTISNMTPKWEHHTFKGWLVNGQLKQPGDTLTDISTSFQLVAQWEEVPHYTVTFKPENGDDDKTEDVYVGEPVARPTDPTWDGHIFDDWYDEHGEKYDFTKPVTQNITLTAWWKVKVTFDPDNGDPVIEQLIYDGSHAEEIDDPKKDGFEFAGWFYEDGKEFSFSDPIDESTKVKAKWIALFDITYDANGGKVKGKDSITETYKDQENIKITEAATSDKGLKFAGWQEVDGKLYQAGDSYTVTKETTFVAKWKLPIVIDPTGGSYEGSTEPTTVEEDYDGKPIEIKAPEAATKAHNSFLGWKGPDGKIYKAGESLQVDGAVTFEAVWASAIYKITYDPNGGVFRESEDPTTIDYEGGEVIEIAEAPERDGYEFLYWKGSEYQPGDSYTVEGDHTFVAQWEKVVEEEEENEVKGKTKKTKSPETGDGNHMINWYMLMCLAQILFFAAIALRTKREDTK